MQSSGCGTARLSQDVVRVFAPIVSVRPPPRGPPGGPNFGAARRPHNPRAKRCTSTVLVHLLAGGVWGRQAAPESGPKSGPELWFQDWTSMRGLSGRAGPAARPGCMCRDASGRGTYIATAADPTPRSGRHLSPAAPCLIQRRRGERLRRQRFRPSEPRFFVASRFRNLAVSARVSRPRSPRQTRGPGMHGHGRC